jgi:zinc protease
MSTPRVLLSVASALALALSSPALAQTPAKINFVRDTLDNGLELILAEDHSAQVVAVDLWYDVGSRNERLGRSGFAHLFEHMMFQGSANVKKNDHGNLIERAGGFSNATTNEDRTSYFQVVPSNRLNLVLWLEADRMRTLAVTDTNFNNQREAVKEERRLRVDNQPYLRAIFEDNYAAFDSTGCFAYAHSIIGSMADLDGAKTEDVQAFFDMYYVPNNATLVIAGDFDPVEARRLAREYFGGIPRGKEPPAVSCRTPFSGGHVRKKIHDPKANLPATVQVYRIPKYDDPDSPALELLATILGQGESSRLNRKLAREAKLAVASQTFYSPFGPRRGPGVFMALAIANQGVNVDSLDAMLSQEVAKVAAEGVTEAELTKAKNSFRAQAINDRQQALNVAVALNLARMYLGSADAVNTSFDRYMKVTLDDIKRAAAKYLRADNALVLILSSETTS